MALFSSILGFFKVVFGFTKIAKDASALFKFAVHAVRATFLVTASAALTPKVKFGNRRGQENEIQSRNINSRSAVAPREIVYGTVRKGGNIVFLEKTGNNGEHLHIVLLHASHECESLGKLYVDDQEVPLTAGSGEGTLRTPTSGNKYENHIEVYDHLGKESQDHDSTLSQRTDWTSFDDLKGICYSYIRLTLDAEDNVFPSGLPVLTRIVEGKKLYDPRTATKAITDITVATPPVVTSASHGYSNGDRVYIRGIAGMTQLNDREFTVDSVTTNTFELKGIGSTGLSAYTSGGTISEMTFSSNAALVIGDFLRSDFAYGRTGTNVGTIDSTTWTTAANAADDDITLSDSSTEKRYAINGVINSTEDPQAVITELRKNCAGFTEYIGGKWIIHMGKWRAPSINFNEADFASGISTQTKDDRRSSANRIKGTYANADDDYNLIEFPAVTNATYLSEDNDIESFRDVQFRFLTSTASAQRVAKIMLERGRQQITHEASFKLKAMQIQPGDTFGLRFDKYGYGAYGTHSGSNNASTLTDSTQAWTTDSLIGYTLKNLSDGSEGVITANTATTITATLSGGTDNDFDTGDTYEVGKNFVCLSHQLTQSNDAYVVKMTFRETGSAVFDWNNGEETDHDTSPNTTLPDPFTVTAPAFALTDPLDSDETYVVKKGTIFISRLKVSWQAAGRNATNYEIQWRKTSESNYDLANSAFVAIPSTHYFITDVEDGVAYTVRIRAVTGLNKSAWVESSSHTIVGRSTPPAQPSNFSATATASGVSITVDKHAAIDFRRYLVYRLSSGATAPTPGTTTPSFEFEGTSFLDATAVAGTVYDYYLAAEDFSANFSAVSSVQSVTAAALAAAGATNNGTTINTSGNVTGGITVESATGVVESQNYSTNSTGWHIDGDGNAEFNDATIRGDLLAGTVSINDNFQVTSAGAVTIGDDSAGKNYFTFQDTTDNQAAKLGLYDSSGDNVGYLQAVNDWAEFKLFTGSYSTAGHVNIDSKGLVHIKTNGAIDDAFAVERPIGSTSERFNIGITKTGILEFGLGGTRDCNLYRDSSGVLKTDDSLIVGTDLTVDGNLTANDLDLRSQMSSLRAHANVSGGGTLTYTSTGYFKWSSRFIVISNGRGSHFSTTGYFDINCPTSGTITGVGGASNKTATSDGIPLSTWEALYYILPIGSSNSTVYANFRVCRYTADIDVPSNWLLLAVRNADSSNAQVHVINRYQLKAGGYSINTSDRLHAGRGNISDGSHTTGSTGYFPGFFNRTYGHEIEAASDGSGSTLHIARETGAVLNIGADANADLVYFRNTNSSSSGVATAVGSISITSSSTAFNTSSDYRLKENVVSITDGIDRLKQLNPSRFNFKIEPDVTVDGFLAHEVSDIVPESISGTKDAMKDEQYEISPAVYDDDGELISEKVMGTRSVPDYQGIDQSKLVPLLTAALQEAVEKIDDLESRLAALENAPPQP